MKAEFEPLKYNDLTELTVNEIRRRILRRELEGNAQIPVDIVAQQLGVSRTPVIEALKQLSNEGLVQILPRRGCFVNPLTAKGVSDIFGVREAVELYSARAVIESGRNRDLKPRLAMLLEKMNVQRQGDQLLDVDKFAMSDRAFHDAIVDATDNDRLKEVYRNLNAHMYILRAQHFMSVAAASQVMEDHQEIQTALDAGDITAAESAIRDHLSKIRLKMIEFIEMNGGSL